MEVYDVEGAALKLKCSKYKIYELIREERIKPITKLGKAIRIPEISLDAFILGVSVEELLDKKYKTKIIEVEQTKNKDIDYEAIGNIVASALKKVL